MSKKRACRAISCGLVAIFWLGCGRAQPTGQLSQSRQDRPPEKLDTAVASSIAPSSTSAVDASATLERVLKNGTPQEKERALNKFMEDPKLEQISAVIEAILDDTVSPRHGDTGWGQVYHQAATAMCKFAQKFDGKTQKERGYDAYSFHNDGGVGTEERRREVHANWLKWWQQNKAQIQRRMSLSPSSTPPDPSPSALPAQSSSSTSSGELSKVEGSPAELRRKVEESRRIFHKLRDAGGGKYTYATRFSSWTGFGWQSTLHVAGGKVIKREYRSHDDKGKQEVHWIEEPGGAAVGSHPGQGAAAVTIDTLYQQCLDEVLARDPAMNKLSVYLHKNGVLALCVSIHKQCADDCSRGPRISSVTFP